MRLYYRDTYIIHLTELCYTETMAEKQAFPPPDWLTLTDTLREGFAPLAVIGAQILYAGAPLLRLFWPEEQVYRLAAALEAGPGQAQEEEKKA